MYTYGQSFGSAQRATDILNYLRVDVQLKRIKNNEHLENMRFEFHFTFKINFQAGSTAQCYHTQCLVWVAMGLVLSTTKSIFKKFKKRSHLVSKKASMVSTPYLLYVMVFPIFKMSPLV